MLTNPNYKYILAGDFNSRNRLWNCQTNNSWGNILYEKIQPNTLEVVYPYENTYIPSDPRRRPSTLDLFITNNTNILSSVKTVNDSSSDHLPVIRKINFIANLYENHSILVKQIGLNTPNT